MQDEDNLNQENKKEELFNKSLKPLRTYQGDVERMMGDNNVSVATVAIAEQKRRIEENVGVTENSNSKNKFFIYFGIFLFIAGLSSLATIYYIKSQNNPLNRVVDASIINYTQKSDVDFNGLDKYTLENKIVEEKGRFDQKINSLLYINFVDQGEKTDIEKILTLFSPSIPQTLLRSLDDKYMFGVYWQGKNELFIILTVKDYGTSFAGMLKWEEDMGSDLAKIFGISNIGTTTKLGFVDESAQNRDLRVLKDSENKSVLVYSFIDKNTIFIASNEEVLSAVFGKFVNSKMVR